MSFPTPTLTRTPKSTPISSPTILTIPTDVIYTCPSCRLIFDSILEGKDHFRTSPKHAGTYDIPVVSGDTDYDADLAARGMIAVMEAVPELIATRVKRKADTRERSSLLVRKPLSEPVSTKHTSTKRKAGSDDAVVPAKKARVRHIDYEDVNPLPSPVTAITHADGTQNRSIQNVLTHCSTGLVPPDSQPMFGATPNDQDCDISYKDV